MSLSVTVTWNISLWAWQIGKKHLPYSIVEGGLLVRPQGPK